MGRNYKNNGVHAINMEKVKAMLRKHDLVDPAFTILDFGCGDGYFLKELSDIFPIQFGCDISAEAVAKARNGNPAAQIKQNAKELPFRDRQFDLIFMIKSISSVAPGLLDFYTERGEAGAQKGRKSLYRGLQAE